MKNVKERVKEETKERRQLNAMWDHELDLGPEKGIREKSSRI